MLGYAGNAVGVTILTPNYIPTSIIGGPTRVEFRIWNSIDKLEKAQKNWPTNYTPTQIVHKLLSRYFSFYWPNREEYVRYLQEKSSLSQVQNNPTPPSKNL